MKKLITLLLLFPLFISCSKEDDKIDNIFIDQNLIGVQWRISQDQLNEIWIFTDSKKIGYGVISEIDRTIKKVSNGTYDYKTTTDGKLIMNGKTYNYKIEGNKLTIKGYNFTKIESEKEYRIIE